MFDFYKNRGYGPIFSIDEQLKKFTASWYPYGKRNIQPNTQPRIKTNRIVQPRKIGNTRFEKINCKVGDVVYSPVSNSYGGGKYGNTTGSKIFIQPYVISEIDDCYMWSRKSVFDNPLGYCTYIWVIPLIEINGKWIISKYHKKQRKFVSGMGHSISINDRYDGVFLSPEEALGSQLRR